jgi:hypothetical protein
MLYTRNDVFSPYATPLRGVAYGEIGMGTTRLQNVFPHTPRRGAAWRMGKMSKRGRDNPGSVIYKAYFAVWDPEQHLWNARARYFKKLGDAECHLMERFVEHFATLDVQWFWDRGFAQGGVEDTYDAYCHVMDTWIREQPEEYTYDYCIEDIEVY